jgi:poly [ADP-ribose] polymerase
MSSKSVNYCCSYLSDRTALLLLCEAELGNPLQELTNASYNAGDTAKAGGMYSTWGKGKVGPSKWKCAGEAHESLKGIKMVSRNALDCANSSPTSRLPQATPRSTVRT